jgi:uncharacterized YccA/Bax inhibitor family protein
MPRTSNPALNDKIFAKEIPADHLRTGWASPAGPAALDTAVGMPPEVVTPWTPAPPRARDYATMTMGGVVSASALLIALVVIAGVFGWRSTTVTEGNVSLPGWLWVAFFGAVGTAIVTILKPNLARVLAPIYAILEGLLLGAISHLYELQFDGIVLQAVGLTAGVFLLMLFLYATRIIKVTDKLRLGIVAATGAVALVYVVNLVLHLFGSGVPFVHDAGAFGILFSLVVVGIAAFNLVLDFDIADRGVAMGAPKYMEWYAGFGLLVTLVWLYLELLRLLSKLRR